MVVLLEQGRFGKLLPIDHANNKIKGVYHLPSHCSRDIMAAVVEASAFLLGLFLFDSYKLEIVTPYGVSTKWYPKSVIA
ncbi:hypothetical protein PP254_gp25 [Streptococcus phage SW12]|uniref:Uncharacterized protein n=1 Tax=Streptococcus phage SW12 TaxID=2419632 RepID=A0A3S5H186_9CAUD|nr:hypothetical protein PP254_gp25 [Streptococcus phage SW12]AYP29475.1 hypothetical protein SW12_025 [Streptococcus phage SW12]